MNLFIGKLRSATIIAGPMRAIERVEADAHIDLREFIDDMSDDILQYLEALAVILDEIESGKKRIAFGCEGGCGRTGTVLLMLTAVLYKEPEKVRKIYEEFARVRKCGPEIEAQRRMVVATLLAAMNAETPEEFMGLAYEIYDENYDLLPCEGGRWTRAYLRVFDACLDEDFEELYERIFGFPPLST